MELSPTAKVGMMTVVALIFMGLIFTQIGHMGSTDGTPYTVVFSDVMGLKVRAPVQLSGVRVGYVAELKLNDQNLVEVVMNITRPDAVLYSSDYFIYTITSDLLGDKWLDIKPGPVPENARPMTSNDRITGVSPISFDTLARQGSEVLTDVKNSVAALNEIIDDPGFKSDIKQSVDNFRDITGNLKGASADARNIVKDLQVRVNDLADSLQGVVGRVDDTVATFQTDARFMGQDLRDSTGAIRGMVKGNATNINELVANLKDISASLRRTAESVEQLATDENVKGDVKAVATNLRKVSEEVAGITSDVRQITSDPVIQDDIKTTIHNVRQTTDSAKRTVDKVEGVVDKVAGTDGKGGLLSGRWFQADISHDWSLRNGNPSTNINAMIFPDGPWTGVVGVDSIGNDNLVNLQVGRTWDSVRLRAGVIRSQVGIGADAWLFDKRFEANLDVYDTHKVKVDVTGKVMLPLDFYVYGGVRNLTSNRERTPVVGVGKRF